MYSFFFFKQKTAYEMRISDWSSDVCSSDLDRSIVAGTRMRRTGSCADGGCGKSLGYRGHCDGDDGDQDRHPHPAHSAGHRGRVVRGYTGPGRAEYSRDRKSVVEGKSGSVRVDLGGSRSIKKKKQKKS